MPTVPLWQGFHHRYRNIPHRVSQLASYLDAGGAGAFARFNGGADKDTSHLSTAWRAVEVEGARLLHPILRLAVTDAWSGEGVDRVAQGSTTASLRVDGLEVGPDETVVAFLRGFDWESWDADGKQLLANWVTALELGVDATVDAGGVTLTGRFVVGQADAPDPIKSPDGVKSPDAHAKDFGAYKPHHHRVNLHCTVLVAPRHALAAVPAPELFTVSDRRLNDGEALAGRLLAAPTGMDGAAAAGAEDHRSPLHGRFGVYEGNARKPRPGAEADPAWPKRDALGLFQALLKDVTAALRPSPVHPLHLVRVDDHLFATLPGEPTARAAWEIERAVLAASGASSASVLGYVGDYAGYLTTDAEYRAQHYEGAMTLYGRNTLAHLAARLAHLATSPAFTTPAPETWDFDRAAAPEGLAPESAAPAAAEGAALPPFAWEDEAGLHAAWLWPDAPPPTAPEVRVERYADGAPAELTTAPAAAAVRLPHGAGWEVVVPPVPPGGGVRLTPELPEGWSAAPVEEGHVGPPVPEALSFEAAAGPPPRPDEAAIAALVAAELARDPIGLGRRLLRDAGHTGPIPDTLAREAARALGRHFGAEPPEAVPALSLEASHLDIFVPPTYDHVLPGAFFDLPLVRHGGVKVDPNLTTFETRADWANYAFVPNTATYEVVRAFYRPDAARRPSDFASRFAYPLRAPEPGSPTVVAMFADFANGLYMPRLIARQLELDAGLHAAFHLGDVYYNGTRQQYVDYVDGPLGPLYGRIPVYALTGNHDLYSLGGEFHAFLDRKRTAHPEVQLQEGHSWRVRAGRFDLVGIDCQWDFNRRIRAEHWTARLLRRWLREARAAGQTTILCTSSHGWDFGERQPTDLFDDLRGPVVDAGLVDLWFWGDVHHCALWAPSAKSGPTWACCVGHGGYPYDRLDPRKAGRSFAGAPAWFEDRHRFWGWTDTRGREVRPDMGNQGWCRMSLHHDGRIELRFIDWLGRPRHHLALARPPGGGALVAAPEP